MKNSTILAPVKTVDEYLDRLPDEQRAALEKLRKIIKSAAPWAEEVISYQVPTYRQHGPLVCFGAYPGHCSLYVIKKSLLVLHADELQGYKTAGTTIHFTPEKPLPGMLVKKIVKARIKDNEERYELKKKI